MITCASSLPGADALPCRPSGRSLTRRMLLFGLPLIIWQLPATAFAQDAAWRIQDCDLARSALGNELHGNLTVTSAGVSTRCRFLATSDAFEATCTDGSTHRVGNGGSEDDFGWTLLAAALGTAELNVALRWADMPLPETLQDFDTLAGPAGHSLIQLVGTPQAGLALQHDTSQLRQIRTSRESDDWLLTIHQFSPLSNGWYPGSLVIAVNGVSFMSVTIDDLAADEASLSPVQSPATPPTPSGAIRFPRLPL